MNINTIPNFLLKYQQGIAQLDMANVRSYGYRKKLWVVNNS